MSEEDIKSKLVLPLLQDIGVDIGELSFETSFTIQLGHGVYNIKQERAKTAGGRSDVLCKRNGKPFFIIETKTDEVQLTAADRQQALSYARLLEPMAVFVIVTNGIDLQIYDTISGKEISSLKDKASTGFSLDLASELALRHQALRDFIGFSAANLDIFFRVQNDLRLKPFRSDEKESEEVYFSKKYIPSTYVQRSYMDKAYADFLGDGVTSVFPIIGDSGVGKTNSLCHLPEAAFGPVYLFYSGGHLGASIVDDIASDFNLSFSAEGSLLAIFKKIASILAAPKQLVILVDAVDEWDIPDKHAQLGQLAEVCYQFGIKIVLSCKKEIWEDFLMQRGTATRLSNYVAREVPLLTEFSDEELTEAVVKYADDFKVAATPLPKIAATYNPLAVRIAFEISHDSNVPLDLSSLSRSTVARYLESRLKSTFEPKRLMRYLKKIAEVLFQADTHLVDEERIRDALDLGLDDELPAELFHQNILYRYVNESGRSRIGFYFSLIRDHFIATFILAFSEQHKLSNLLKEKVFDSILGESAFAYYFRTGSPEEQCRVLLSTMEYDVGKRSTHLLRLLAWHGNGMAERLETEIRTRVLNHVVVVVKEEWIDRELSEQILEVLKCVAGRGDSKIIIDVFEVLLTHPEHPYEGISYGLAEILQEQDEPFNTGRLVNLALKFPGEKGYIRRYMIEALEDRNDFDVRATFLQLLVDDEPNVQTWLMPWYVKLEDESLRDKVIAVFDEKRLKSGAGKFMQFLSYSKLPDTAAKIAAVIEAGELHDNALTWAYRALGELRHAEAVPLFVSKILAAPSSDLAGHLLIALGELEVREAVDLVFELIKSESFDLGRNSIWLPHAFQPRAGTADYEKLADMVGNNGNRITAGYAISLLVGSGDVRWCDIILSYVFDESVDFAERSFVVADLNNKILGKQEPGQDLPVFSSSALDRLHASFVQNDDLSAFSLALLVNANGDLHRVASELPMVFPGMTSNFILRQIGYVRKSRWHQLRTLILPWFHAYLTGLPGKPFHASNCFTLLCLIGTQSTVDIISMNREFFTKQFGRGRLDSLETALRQGRGDQHLMW